MLKRTWYFLLGVCSSISILAATIGLATLIGETLDAHISTPNAGDPYYVGVLLCGISFAMFMAYCTYLLAFNWNARLFQRALQTLVMVHVMAAATSSAWFSIRVERIDAINGIWLLCIITTEILALAICKKVINH